MNKCYQVIWSTVKQAYIVVSELAGQRTKGYTTTVQGARVVLAALVAASVIGSAQGETPYDFKLTKHVEMEKDSSVSGGEFFVDVNDPVLTTATDAVNVAQLKLLASNVVAGQTHYYSVKNDGVNVRNEAVEINPSIITGDSSNYNNDGAKGFGSIVSGIGSQIQVGQPSGDAYKVGNSYDSTIGNQFFMQGFGAAASGLLNTIDATGKHPFDGFGNTLNGVGNTTVNASGVSTMGDANSVTNTNNYQGNDGMHGLTELDGITLKMSKALKKGVNCKMKLNT